MQQDGLKLPRLHAASTAGNANALLNTSCTLQVCNSLRHSLAVLLMYRIVATATVRQGLKAETGSLTMYLTQSGLPSLLAAPISPLVDID